MSLQQVYQTFLSDPRSASLASNVALIYITTTTRVDGAEAVVKHLARQDHVLKRKSQQVIDTVEGFNSLSLDVDTTVEFVSGGGPYLPSLDDNFLSDRVATFPTVHIVRFNSQNQIQQVKVYWDQASLLKQVEVIGSRSRGWPIRDGKDQSRLIKTAASSAPVNDSPAPVPVNKQTENGEAQSKVASPGKRYIKDPYAAESLEELLSPSKDRADPVRPPRAPASAKPPQRDLSELFVSHEDDETPEPSPSRNKPVAPKGAGKSYQASRIFDDDETVDTQDKPQQIAYRAHPKRFDHFELGGDNSDREIKPKISRPVSSQGKGPQWNFEDFVTPEKPKRQLRGQELRSFGISDDEEFQKVPPARSGVTQPRRDAETHFQLSDDFGTQGGSRIISSFQNKGLSLYKNHLFAGEDEPAESKPSAKDKQPLSVAQKGQTRKKDLETHWTITDESPAKSKADENKKPIAADRQRAVKMMEPSWESYDQSPQPSKAVRPLPQRHAMRSVNERSWNIGGDE
ncbi:uncharacterized protein BDW43DRAFT_320320 [Aspergillus alliaceus]|uniref:uncharacterized protein n=1 Tax=Petromyces alliaceus TaxID=209559 RepID=UPI0012A612D7|nr:uncharacterized protein BDW43DRAFT_320320 [Aspergillus alliaceus]KAB8238507.1 hypothetical protein BDW43DRAFT_320320 [Aspergillus alliaceus]